MKKFFSLIWRGWMKFAHALGWVNTRILLTVTYFVIFAIAWLVTRLGRQDLLDKRMASVSYHARTPARDTLATVRRLF